jgi:2'-5' RNA ligase
MQDKLIRCFIAIDLPEEVKKEIVNIQMQLPQCKGKLTEKKNLHLTFKFLGEIPEDKVQEAVKRLKKIKFKKFKATLGSLGVFKPSEIKIVWIMLENCDELQKAIDDALDGLFAKETNFTSHLTIARVKALINQGNQGNQGFLYDMKRIRVNPAEFEVKSFSLKKSTLTPKGPIYEDIAEIKLK